MDKYTIAQYLVNLHTLLSAQEATGLIKSVAIVEEYERQWGLLKQTIEENKDE